MRTARSSPTTTKAHAERLVRAYKIYRADEMPETIVYLVQTMEDSGPFGAKAVAEIPKDGVAPAIRNAIINATGVAINDLPFTPERVWAALEAQ